MPVLCTSRTFVLVVLGILVTALWMACSSDISGISTPRAESLRLKRLRNANPGVGFDPGVALTEAAGNPITDMAVAGAALPLGGTDDDLLVSLVAFVTDEGAAQIEAGAMDANGTGDVFLAAVVSGEVLVKGKSLPTGFRQGMVEIFRDERCVRCHGFLEPNGFRLAESHIGKTTNNSECIACHTPEVMLDPTVTIPGTGIRVPETIVWRAPIGLSLEGVDDQELFRRAKAGLPTPVEHLRDDDKITWAIAHGRVPFRGMADGGTVPITLGDWWDMLDAWEVGGEAFDTSERRFQGAPVLVSRQQAPAVSGNGASFAPSLTYVPNPAFDPATAGSIPATGTPPPSALAGWVFVAFASDATDLTGTPSPNRDVWRSRVAVYFDPATRQLKLDYDATGPSLVSVSTSGSGGNGDSNAPSISADGNRIAFSSQATDLVTGFMDANGADQPDVYVRDLDASTTALRSAGSSAVAPVTVGPSPVLGANGGSYAPSISSDGVAVAFESDASDLVPEDNNGAQDVFYAVERAGAVTIDRASVQTGNVEVVGGTAHGASVWHDDQTGEAWVAFESTHPGLDLEALSGLAAPGAYVHWSGGRRTILLSRGSALPSHSPVVSGDGSYVAFASADDLDGLREDDNGVDDIFTVDLIELQRLLPATTLQIQRVSLSAAGSDADQASAAPRLGAVIDQNGLPSFDVILGFRSRATNLGGSPNSDLIVQFLRNPRRFVTRAEFTATPRGGFPSEGVNEDELTVEFRDLSTFESATGMSWLWNFGDGATSTEQNPSHTYRIDPNTGQKDFDVTLTVTDGLTGESHPRTRVDYISLIEERPWAEIFEDIFKGCAACHAPGAQYPQLDMVDQDTAYDELINVQSRFPGCNLTRVVPGEPDQSLLYLLLLPEADPRFPDCGGARRMPLGTGKLSGSQIAEVRAWIERGAPQGDALDFVADDTLGPVGHVVTFTNKSSQPEGTTWLWNFGNGNTSTEQDPPPQTYASGGVFPVTLTATRPNQAPETSNKVIMIEVVEARFSVSADTVAAGGTVMFTNQSPAANATYSWDFGGIACSPPPSATASAQPSSPFACAYPVGGTFTVTLTATNRFGERHSVSDVVTVVEASFATTLLPSELRGTSFGQEGTVTDSSMNALSWQWDLGNGAMPTGQGPHTTFYENNTQATTNYTVMLTVTGPNNVQHSTMRGVSIPASAGPMASFTLPGSPASPITGTKGTTVQFTDTSTLAVAWEWDFDNDGSFEITRQTNPPAGVQDPSWTYNAGGNFRATLRTIGPSGRVDTTTSAAGAIQLTEAKFSSALLGSEVRAGKFGQQADFTDTSINAQSWQWEFGNGEIRTGPGPHSTFYENNTQQTIAYTARLTITGPGGVQDVVSREFMISPPGGPGASFTMATSPGGLFPVTGPKGTMVKFTDTSTLATAWEWDFDSDGTYEITRQTNPPNGVQDPTWTYNSGGDFRATLRAIGPSGLASTAVSAAGAIRLTEAKFTGSLGASEIRNKTFGQPATVTDGSINALSWQWDLGNGSTPSGQGPHTTFYENAMTTPRTYTATLTVTGPGGATDEATRQFTINPAGAPSSGFTIQGAPVTALKGSSVQFFSQATNAVMWEWDFDDDGVYEITAQSHPPCGVQNPSWPFSNGGNFRVRHRVLGPSGLVSESTSAPNSILVIEAKLAISPGTSVSACEPLTFTSQSEPAGLVTHSWSIRRITPSVQVFTSIASSFQLKFDQLASYRVTLTASRGGVQDSASQDFTINARPGASTWSTVFARITTAPASCTGCHNGITQVFGTSRTVFDLRTSTTAYNNLVGVSSILCTSPQLLRVDPCEPNNSVMWGITGPGPKCFTHAGGQRSVAEVLSWINGGAQRN